MIHFLRHVSFCLWVALVIGGFGRPLDPAAPPAGVGDGCGAPTGRRFAGRPVCGLAWTVNRLGQRRVYRWMHAADRAEREGLRADAEKAYRSALGMLDSSWVSPGARRRILLPLAGRAARFYLSQSRLSAGGEDFISAYLWANPRDEEVAEQWVQHAERQGGLRDEHQDLADRLGNAHPRNAAIQREVARSIWRWSAPTTPRLQNLPPAVRRGRPGPAGILLGPEPAAPQGRPVR